MKLVVKLHTTDFRGDHSADCCKLYDVDGTETVQSLAKRLLHPAYGGEYVDHIEIRVLHPAAAERKSE